MHPVRAIDPPKARRPTTPPGRDVPLDARIAELAARQGGVVSRAQLERLGLSGSGVDARVARGALHVVHRGVYAVGHPLVRGLGLEHAALLAAPPGTPRSHRTAGANWHLRSWDSRTVEVTARSGARSRPGLTVYRNRLHPDDVTELDRLPITTVARTLFDLAEVLTAQQHARAWEAAERMQLADRRALRVVAERNPGRRALKVVLPLLASRLPRGTAETRSPLEVDFLAFAARHLAAFGSPQVNVMVHGFELDAYWPQARFAVELDSRLHHDNDPAFERDRAKWAALTTAGEVVFPLTSRRLTREPLLVAEQLARLLTDRWRR